jgi:hypothetical protein
VAESRLALVLELLVSVARADCLTISKVALAEWQG